MRMFADNGLSFEPVHDTCIVPPGQLASGSGKQYAVYTPWFRTWIHHLHMNPELLEPSDPPARNPGDTRDKFEKLFGCSIPGEPPGKKLGMEQAGRFHDIWPAGEHNGRRKLEDFCDEKIGDYAMSRNIPAADGTSSISVHLAAGTLSARTVVRTAREQEQDKEARRWERGHSDVDQRSGMEGLLQACSRELALCLVSLHICVHHYGGLVLRHLQHEQAIQARIFQHRMVLRPVSFRSLDTRPHRLPHRRCRYASACACWLDAQQVPNDSRFVPFQGSPSRLAYGRTVLHGTSHRRGLCQ